MNSLILAAGLGSRLHSYTKDKPKALVQVNNQPLLGHQIRHCLESSIDHIFIVTGYKHELIASFVQQFPQDRITLIHNNHFDSTNSAFSWLLASPYLVSQPYIHLNCDIIFSPPLLSNLIAKYNETKLSTLVVRSDLELGPDMEEVIFENNRIIACLARIKHILDAKAYGLAVFNPSDTSNHHSLLSGDLISGDRNANFYSAIRRSTLITHYLALKTSKDSIYEFNTVSDLEGYSTI